jgi:hypothetical protein
VLLRVTEYSATCVGESLTEAWEWRQCPWRTQYRHVEGLPFQEDFREQWELDHRAYHDRLGYPDHQLSETVVVEEEQEVRAT